MAFPGRMTPAPTGGIGVGVAGTSDHPSAVGLDSLRAAFVVKAAAGITGLGWSSLVTMN